jgi:protein ImuB
LWLLHTPETLPCALHDLQLVDGPERIETGWWDGNDVRRDYFVAASAGGRRLWVFHDLRAGGWYLHGIFR